MHKTRPDSIACGVTKGPWQIIAQVDAQGKPVAYSAYNTVSGEIDFIMDPQDLSGFMRSNSLVTLTASGMYYLGSLAPAYQQRAVSGALKVATGIANGDGTLAKQGAGDMAGGWAGAVQDPGWWLTTGLAVTGGVLASAPMGRLGSIEGGVTKGTRYGPMNPGPLDDATAATFRSGSYTATTASETTTLYRVYGGNARKLGPYWTRTKPSGPLQSQLDSALAPQWGNTADNVVSIQVPKGTTIYEGAAAPQSTGAGQILGGGNQVYIPRVDPKWIK